MVYRYNRYQYSVPAEVVGKHFEKVEKKYGSITSQNVLESARSVKSPIHSLFEWDDTKAAEEYRLRQATLLITNLAVEVEIPEAKPIICRAYVNVSDAKKGRFMKIDSAFKVEETREIVIERALRELRAFQEKYKNLEVLADLFAEIDSLTERVG